MILLWFQVQIRYEEKILHLQGGQSLEQALQGSDYSTSLMVFKEHLNDALNPMI